MNYYEDNGWASEFRHHMPDTLLLGEWADKFNMENYVIMFEQINPNTLIWQVIVTVLLFWFSTEIKSFLIEIVKKIKYIKSFSPTKVEAYEETKETKKVRGIATKPFEKLAEDANEKLDERVDSYSSATRGDPDAIFLFMYIEVENLILKLYALIFPENDEYFNRRLPRTKFRKLVQKSVLNSESKRVFDAMSIFKKQISNGDKPLKKMANSQVFLKTLFLLKDELTDVIKIEEAKKEQ